MVRDVFGAVAALLSLVSNLALRRPAEVLGYSVTVSTVSLLVIVGIFHFVSFALAGLGGWVILLAIALLLLSLVLVVWYVGFHRNCVFTCAMDQTRHLSGTELTEPAQDEIANGVGDPSVIPQDEYHYFCQFVGKDPGRVWTPSSYNGRWWRGLALSTLLPVCLLAGLYLGAAAATLPALTVTKTSEGTEFLLEGDVLFASDEDQLRDTEIIELEELMVALVADPPERILVVGHTDSTDTDAYNQDLSERRAETVRTWLETESGRASLDPIEIEAEGRGESDLLVRPEESHSDRQKNRRVERDMRRSW